MGQGTKDYLVLRFHLFSRIAFIICQGPLGYIRPPWAWKLFTPYFSKLKRRVTLPIHTSQARPEVGNRSPRDPKGPGLVRRRETPEMATLKVLCAPGTTSDDYCESWDFESGDTLSVLCVEQHSRQRFIIGCRSHSIKAIEPTLKTSLCHFVGVFTVSLCRCMVTFTKRSSNTSSPTHIIMLLRVTLMKVVSITTIHIMVAFEHTIHYASTKQNKILPREPGTCYGK